MSYDKNVFPAGRGGDFSSLNITVDAIVKATPGRVVRITVNTVTAVAAITVNDCATTGAAAAGNTVFTIPSGAAVGTVYYLDFPMLTGIVLKFGSATGALAVAYD